MMNSGSALLKLLQLSDSALPVGSTAHSFGLETLVADELLTVSNLPRFMADYLAETGLLEAVFCRAAYRLDPSTDDFAGQWVALNELLGTYKPARESRTAGTTLGRRFLQLALEMLNPGPEAMCLQNALQPGCVPHHCCAFGFVARVLGITEDLAVLAYLQQSVTCLLSACQRLMPLGQVKAHRINWDLKQAIEQAVRRSGTLAIEDVACFTPLVELASMRHPLLRTRLFIS